MNKMSALVNKIERRLGFAGPCKLPTSMDKTTWPAIIAEDTIPTFSRSYPHAITIYLNRDTPRDRDGYYLISEKMVDGADIIGFKDIDWRKFSQPTLSGAAYSSLGIYDEINSMSDYTFDDVALTQCTVDLNSTFQTSIVPDFQYPNRLKFTMTGTREIYSLPYDFCPVTLFVCHPLNLMTIPPTVMDIFEDLATADVAATLYQNLKYYDGLETIFVNVDLKLDDLRQRADERKEIVQILQENRVSAANRNQPLMWTI